MVSQDILIIGAVLLLAAGFITYSTFNAPPELPPTQAPSEGTIGIMVGDFAPDFTLETTTGEQVSLSDYRGKTVVINFWATWCPFCVDEMPLFQEEFAANQDKLVILGVNLQETKETAADFGHELGITYPLLLDPAKQVTGTYNVFTQPVTYFIDEEGRIFERKFGPLTETEFREKLYPESA